GIPENPNPATSNGQSASTVRQCRPAWYQIPGTVSDRCGSLAKRGLPVVVYLPATTHELEPTSSPRPSSAGTVFSARLAASRPLVLCRSPCRSRTDVPSRAAAHWWASSLSSSMDRPRCGSSGSVVL